MVSVVHIEPFTTQNLDIFKIGRKFNIKTQMKSVKCFFAETSVMIAKGCARLAKKCAILTKIYTVYIKIDSILAEMEMPFMDTCTPFAWSSIKLAKIGWLLVEMEKAFRCDSVKLVAVCIDFVVRRAIIGDSRKVFAGEDRNIDSMRITENHERLISTEGRDGSTVR